MENEMLTIKDVLQILKKRWVLILSIVLVSTIAATAISFYVLKPQYKTSTKLFIGKEISGETTEYQQSDIQMYQKLMKTYAGLIQSEDLVERAINNRNISMNAKEILSSLTVTASEDDQFLSVSLVTLNQNEGKEILNLLTEEFMKTSKTLIPNGNVQVVTTPKVPDAPFSPNKKMNIVIAFAMGLMVGVTLSLFLEYLDNSVKSKEEVEKLLGVPVIGTVPEVSDKLEDSENNSINSGRRSRKCKTSKHNQGAVTQNLSGR